MKILLLAVTLLAGAGCHPCVDIYTQIAECPCGNSRERPDPSGPDENGCFLIECERNCSTDMTVYTPAPPADMSNPDSR